MTAVAQLLARLPEHLRHGRIRRPFAGAGVVRVRKVTVDVLEQGRLRGESHTAPGHDTLVRFAATVRLHMLFEPVELGALLVVHLTTIPEARVPRALLRVDVRNLQMVEQLGAAVELGVTIAPVASAVQSSIARPAEAFATEVVMRCGTVRCREADRFRLREDGTAGAGCFRCERP